MNDKNKEMDLIVSLDRFISVLQVLSSEIKLGRLKNASGDLKIDIEYISPTMHPENDSEAVMQKVTINSNTCVTLK